MTNQKVIPFAPVLLDGARVISATPNRRVELISLIQIVRLAGAQAKRETEIG